MKGKIMLRIFLRFSYISNLSGIIHVVTSWKQANMCCIVSLYTYRILKLVKVLV